MPKKPMQAGPYFLEPDGSKSDASFHNDLLDDEEAYIYSQRLVIDRKLANGRKIEDLLPLYGNNPRVAAFYKKKFNLK